MIKRQIKHFYTTEVMQLCMRHYDLLCTPVTDHGMETIIYVFQENCMCVHHMHITFLDVCQLTQTTFIICGLSLYLLYFHSILYVIHHCPVCRGLDNQSVQYLHALYICMCTLHRIVEYKCSYASCLFFISMMALKLLEIHFAHQQKVDKHIKIWHQLT